MQGPSVFLGIAAIPFIYYLLALYSAWRYFRTPVIAPASDFCPPVSILKPIRGLDPDAHENLVSFCQLDYPEYEIVFCIDGEDEAVVSVDRGVAARISPAQHSCVAWVGTHRHQR